MAKPFDAALKDLVRNHPADWLRYFGVPHAADVEVLSPDLSALTAMADTLIRAGDRVVHIDLESGPDDGLAARLLLYNIQAHRLTGLPVHSVAVLLRSNAKAANLTGELAYGPQPAGEVRFRFEVVKVWERATADLFAGGLGLMPLAVLGKPPKGQSRAEAIPGTLVSIAEAAVGSLSPSRSADLVAAALVLAGMHVDPEALRDVIRRFPAVIESSAYAAFEHIVGVKQSEDIILVQGRKKFGEPTPEQVSRLKAIDDVPRLTRIAVSLLDANSWDELLKTK